MVEEFFDRDKLPFKFFDVARGYVHKDKIELCKTELRDTDSFIEIDKPYTDAKYYPNIASKDLAMYFRLDPEPNMKRAVMKAFKHAQLINDASLFIETLHGQNKLYLPVKPHGLGLFSSETGQTVTLNDDFDVGKHERLKIMRQIGYSKDGLFLLPNGVALFDIHGDEDSGIIKKAIAYRYLLEAYSHLESDECMGIKTDRENYTLLGARIRDGEIVIREVPGFNACNLLFSLEAERPPFFKIYQDFNLFEGSCKEGYSQGIYNQDNPLENFLAWAEVLEAERAKTPLFSLNEKISEQLERLREFRETTIENGTGR